MADLSRIVLDPAICSGKPTIRGTRVMVWNVLSYLEAGHSFGDIIEAYPRLTQDDIEAAIAYATELVHEIRVLPKAA